MASYGPQDGRENFYRLVSLLIDVGSTVLRKLLLKHTGCSPPSLKQHLWNNNGILANLKQRGILHPPQIDLLFPPGAGLPDLEKFDISLICCLLQNTCQTNLTQQEYTLFRELRAHRNEILAHTDKASVTENEFQQQWTDVTATINGILQCLNDPQLFANVSDEMKMLKYTSPRHKDVNLLNQWYISDQVVLSAVESLDRTTQQLKRTLETDVLSGIQNANKRLKDDIPNEFKKMREELKNDTDQNVKQIIKEVQHQNKETLEELKEVKEKLEDRAHQVDPAFRNLKKSSERFIRGKSNIRQVQTHLMDQVVHKLANKGSCVISGNPGEGKTLAAVSILKTHYNIDKCIVLSHPREWNIVDVCQTEAILIEDIFGVYGVDESILAEWLRILDMVGAGVQEGDVKVIVTTRANILEKCSSKLSRYSIFQDIVEFSSQKLYNEEKEHMLRLSLDCHNKMLDSDKVTKCVQAFTSPVGFPLCCELFSSNPSLFCLGEAFFEKPVLYFQNCIASLKGQLFAALVFLIYRNGSVKESDLLESNRVCCNDLREISSSLGLQQSLDPPVARSHLQEMKGMFVTFSQGSITYVHSTVYEAVCMMYGKTNPEQVLRICSSEFLHQCLTVNADSECGSNDVEKKQLLVIPEAFQTNLAERLIKEIVYKNEVSRTASHSALLDLTFLDVFVQKIKSMDFLDEVFRTKGKPDRTMFLTKYAKLQNPNAERCLTVLLDTLGKCQHDENEPSNCWKCDVKRICVFECCILDGDNGTKLVKFFLDCGYQGDSPTLNQAIIGGNAGTVVLLLLYASDPDNESLSYAIKGGNSKIVRLIIEHGFLPDTESLNLAIMEGKVDMVRVLLDSGVIPDSSCITSAIKTADEEILDVVLKHGPVPDSASLEIAIDEGDCNVVNILIKYGAIPDVCSLNHAVENDNIEIIEVLMKVGAEPNEETLTSAIEVGNVDIVKAVFEHGVLPEIDDLNHAVKFEDIDIIKEIIDRGVEPDSETLSLAVEENNVAVVNFLIDNGAVPDADSLIYAIDIGLEMVNTMLDNGAEPDTDILNCAVKEKNIAIVKTLIENGAKVSTETICVAEEVGDMDIFRTLVEHLEDPDIEDLNCAIKTGDIAIVRTLLFQNVQPDEDSLRFAVDEDNIDIVTLLMEYEATPNTLIVNNAVKRGQVDIVKKLLNGGAEPDQETVQCALRIGIDMVNAVLEAGADPDTDALDLAVRTKNVDIIDVLMEKGATASLNTMMLAEGIGDFDVVRTIIGHMDLDTEDLEYAVNIGIVTVTTLLEHGIVPDETTLLAAVRHGTVAIAKLLLEKGVKSDVKALNCAVEVENRDAISLLLENGATPNKETLKLAKTGLDEDAFRELVEWINRTHK